MAGSDLYTNDGTLGIDKKPANRERTGKWKACKFILGNECCERLAYYGMSTNLANSLQIRLNQGNAKASTTVTNWQGTCYATPLIGAFLADAYMRIPFSSCLLGWVYTAVPGLEPVCDKGPTSATVPIT